MKSLYRLIFIASCALVNNAHISAQTIDGVINNDGISNNEAHQKCLAAVDYEGCIRVQRGLGKSVIADSPYGYDPDSIR